MVAGITQSPSLNPRKVSARSGAVAEKVSHADKELKPSFMDKAKTLGGDAKIFGSFLLASGEESGANPVQKLLPLALIGVGVPALPALLFKNWVSTANAKLPDDPFWADIVSKLAYAFDPLFQAITIINLIISLLTPSPGRAITYGLLALANHFIAAPNNKKSLDNGVALRAINTEIQSLADELKTPNLTHERKEQIMVRLGELYKKEAEINKSNKAVQAWVQFFGNSIFNFIMSFSFLALIPTLSKSCRYTRVEKYNRESRYDKDNWPINFYAEHDLKKIIFGGAKNWDERKLGSYPKVFFEQLKIEIRSFKEVLLELKEGILNGERFQGTPFGRNKRVEEGVSEEKVEGLRIDGLKYALKQKEQKLGRNLKEGELAWFLWTNRLSQGLFPAATTAINAATRLSIFISALTAFFTLGIEAFAPKSNTVNNPSNSTLNGLTTQQNFVGNTALALTSGLTNVSRGLSAGTSIISSFNKDLLHFNGSVSGGFLGFGGLFSGLAMLADKGFNQPGIGLTLQFISSLLLWLSTGIGVTNRGFLIYHERELKKLNDIKPFERTQVKV